MPGNNRSRGDKSWKEFEALAAEIEKVLAPCDAIVTCPDRLPDIDTGELREVDASIKYEVGSIPILIILECRLRKAKQGTMWIEQLATKRASVGAAKCVAISQSPFTKPAIRKAERLGVELRNLRRMKVQDIKSLAPTVSLHYQCKFERVNLTFEQGMGENGEVLEIDDELNRLVWGRHKHGLDDRIVRYDCSPHHRSIAEYLMNLIDAYYASSSKGDFFVPTLGKKYRFSVAGNIAANIRIGEDYYRLGGAAMILEFSSFFDCATRMDAAAAYSSPRGHVASKIDVSTLTSEGVERHSIVVPEYAKNALENLRDTRGEVGLKAEDLVIAAAYRIEAIDMAGLSSGYFPSDLAEKFRSQSNGR